MSELGLRHHGPTVANDRLLSWTPMIYLAATTIGVLMRLVILGLDLRIPFDRLLHAHSHALYFGWAGLGILATAASPDGTSRWVLAAAWGVSVMAVAFLAVGYAPFSIAASTAVMLAWYGAIRSWWRNSKGGPGPETAAFRIGFGYVMLASVGIWVLAVVQPTGLGGPVVARLAVHAFLSTFGWFFVFGSVGLVALHRLVDAATVRRVLLWWTATAWATFPLGVVGGPEVPILGPISRMAGLLLVYPAWLWIHELWRSGIGLGDTVILRGAAVWLGVKTMGDVSVAVGGSGVFGSVGRQGVVLYLHALLLGYVTTLIAWHLTEWADVTSTSGLLTHHAGVAVMVAGLLMAAMSTAVMIGLWVAAVGAGLVWMAGLAWAVPVWKGLRR